MTSGYIDTVQKVDNQRTKKAKTHSWRESLTAAVKYSASCLGICRQALDDLINGRI